MDSRRICMDSDLCSNKSPPKKRPKQAPTEVCGQRKWRSCQQRGTARRGASSVGAPALLSKVSLHFLCRHGFRRECDCLFCLGKVATCADGICLCYLITGISSQLTQDGKTESKISTTVGSAEEKQGRNSNMKPSYDSQYCASADTVLKLNTRKKKLDKKKRGN